MPINPKNIDEVCANLKNSIGLLGFRYVKYETLNNEKKYKVEETMIEIMTINKLAPIELENKIPNDLYSRIYGK